MLDLPHRMMAELSNRPYTLLHGDTDLSNALLTDQGMALVDFEKASIGPASLDLGRITATVKSPRTG